MSAKITLASKSYNSGVLNVSLLGSMVESRTGDLEVPGSNPTEDKFLKNVKPPLKMGKGVEPHRDRINNDNNNN